MKEEVINAEVVNEVTKKGLISTIASNPVAKYSILAATGAIVGYGSYRLVKFFVGKVKARKAKGTVVEEQPSEEQPDTAAEESKDLN